MFRGLPISRIGSSPGATLKDILQIDNTLRQIYRGRGLWKDFTLELDDTIDASGSFPIRYGVGNACFAADFNDMAQPYPPSLTAWVYDHVGFFGVTPVAQRPAVANTSAATLAELEAEVNKLKQMLGDFGLMAP